MRLTVPIKCFCSICETDFLRLNKRGDMSICTPCQNKKRVSDWKVANPERKAELNRQWVTENRDKDTASKKKWSTSNKGAENAKAALHRAKRRSATPPWADIKKIKEIYVKCPNGHEVDHIIPLCGEKVSGLHVETNLQYLPAMENRMKSNQFEGNA